MIIGNSKVPKQKTQWFFYIHQKKNYNLKLKNTVSTITPQSMKCLSTKQCAYTDMCI